MRLLHLWLQPMFRLQPLPMTVATINASSTTPPSPMTVDTTTAPSITPAAPMTVATINVTGTTLLLQLSPT